MTTLFEMTPSSEDIFNMTVPWGEPCGCYDKRGCLDSIYCACECYNCLTQRKVDAGLLCAQCKTGKGENYITLDNFNTEGDVVNFWLCNHCYDEHRGICNTIAEEEDDTQSDFSDFSEEREREAPNNPFYDERYDDEDNMDPEEREALLEMYFYNIENLADF